MIGSMARRKPTAKARLTAARLASVQAAYQMEVTGAKADTVLGEFVKHRLGVELDGDEMVDPDRELFGRIVRGIAARSADIDGIVDGALDPPWTINRLELLLRAVLRAGVWELLENRDAAAAVVIADYVDVAHAFFGGKEPGLVNAVLDRASRTLSDGPPLSPELPQAER